MTIENYGKIWCLDHCYPLPKTNLSNENHMYKSTIWINLRPMYIKDKIVKGDKNDIKIYLIQENKAYQFIKLNERGPNEDINGIYSKAPRINYETDKIIYNSYR